MTGIIKRIAGHENHMFSRRSRDVQGFLGIQDFSLFNHIGVDLAIWHDHVNLVTDFNLLQNRFWGSKSLAAGLP